MASLVEIAKKLNKDYGNDKMIIKSNIVPHYERLNTRALGMDYPLYGGLPYGRICVYSGLPHSGKTTAACCELAAYQQAHPDKTCVYVDVEHTLDLNFQALMNGIDLSKMYYANPDVKMSGEQILDMIIEMQKADDVGLIVLDSIPALVPEIVLTSDLTKDAGMRATMAKRLYPFCSMMQNMVSEKGNIFIMINQVRDGGKTFTGAPIYKEPGGLAPLFYSSVSVRFGTRKFTKGDDMDACKGTGEGADGFRLLFKITKNKTAPCNRAGGFITYRYATGIDSIHDTLEIALAFDFIHRVNNVTYELIDLDSGEIYKDDKGELLRGKKNDLVDYLTNNKKFQAKYLKMLNKHLMADSDKHVDIIDADTKKEIEEQEEALEKDKKE